MVEIRRENNREKTQINNINQGKEARPQKPEIKQINKQENIGHLHDSKFENR